MKSRTITITVATLIIGLLALGVTILGSRNSRLVPSVQAQEPTQEQMQAEGFAAPFRRRRCNLATINGNYAYQASGTITQPIAPLQIPAGPFAVNSLLTLRYGNFSFKGTQSFNGNIVPAVGTGTYTVNEDCTGSGADASGVPYHFVIADEGKEIRIILAVPNTVVTGIAKRL